MKTALVQVIEQGGNVYGQVSDPNDLMKAQRYLHDRISGSVYDFINRDRPVEVTGFSYSLDDGNSMAIEISRPGRIWTQDGRSFDLSIDPTVTIGAANETLPRIDTIIARLDDDIDAEVDLIPFVRLRTTEELSEAVPPYPPENLSVATERHCQAVIQVKAGTAAASPSPATLASNEIPLYYVAIAPGQTSIRPVDVLDIRDVVKTLRQLHEISNETRIDIRSLLRRISALENLPQAEIDLSQIFGDIRTLGEILGELKRQIDSLRDVPEIRYARPKTQFTDINISKIIATGNVDSGSPCVDIELGGRVNFGPSEVVLEPQNFVDQSVNPRFVQIAGGSAHVRRTVPITLDSVTILSGDGFVDFVEQNAELPNRRSRSATAARDEQFVEVFGGLAVNNGSALGDWHTYDVVNDTLTPRTPSIALPSANQPAMFSCGDGENVIMIAGSTSTSSPRAFKVNANTMNVTEVMTTKPTGHQFIGDLIAPGKVFIVALSDDGNTDYWEYDVASNTFTELGVTGNLPTPLVNQTAGCNWGVNRFALVTFGNSSASGKTYLFDRPSLQWIQQMIPQPYSGTELELRPIAQFRMANINGRPVLIGDKHAVDGNSRIWELVKPQRRRFFEWTPFTATFPPKADSGLCSTIGSNGLASNKAFLFGGVDLFNIAGRYIYASEQSGLIESTFNDEPGVTLAEGSTFVQFELPTFTADWPIAGYMALLRGVAINSDTVKIEVSFDDGENWIELKLGETIEDPESTSPGVRRIRITIYGHANRNPLLTNLIEFLDEIGGDLEDRTVLRFNSSTTTTMGLYIDRSGKISLSSVIEPSTPNKALLHKIVPDGSNAPTVKSYVNKRRPHFKIEGTKGASPSSIEFDNPFSVPVRYVDARGIDVTTAALKQLVSPSVGFDQVIEVDGGGALSSGDHWIVELAG